MSSWRSKKLETSTELLQKNPASNFLDLPRTLWKRRLWIIGSVAIGVLGAVAAIKLIPPRYSASTMIMVESQKIPTNYVRPTVTTGMTERLRTIEQQIVNRENLERIISEMGLYPELRYEVPIDRIVEKARKDLTLEVMGNAVFRIYFRASEPQLAADTANRIAELFIEENLRLRTEQARGTSIFLDQELERTKAALESQEKRVAEFRIRHEGELPEQRDSITEALDGLQSRLQITLDSIDKAELRRLLLQRERQGRRSGDASSSGTDAGANVASARLRQARLELVELLSRYTEEHPDVIRLRREIAQLEEQAASEPQRGSAAVREQPTDPELSAIDLEIRRLESERQTILLEMARYQRRLERLPRVAQELVSLTRDYENLQSSYESLLAKRIDARLAENLERKQQSEQFTVLERAVPPSEPYFPNRILVMLLALAVSGATGLGLALLREETDQTFRDEIALREAFPGVRCLGSIPRISTPTPPEDRKTA